MPGSRTHDLRPEFARSGVLIGALIVVAVGGCAAFWATGARANARARCRTGRRSSDVLGVEGLRMLYDAIAPLYDVPAALYHRVLGRSVTRRAIVELWLKRGDTVVDLGTGTGVNLPSLAHAVGPSGRVIGVDVSEQMLARAAARVSRTGCRNVDLVTADFTVYALPAGTAAVFSSFAMEVPPNYDEVLRRVMTELCSGGRVAVTGMRMPERWPRWLVAVGIALNKPFGVSAGYTSHQPWRSLARYGENIVYEESFAGAIYRAAASAP